MKMAWLMANLTISRKQWQWRIQRSTIQMKSGGVFSMAAWRHQCTDKAVNGVVISLGVVMQPAGSKLFINDVMSSIMSKA